MKSIIICLILTTCIVYVWDFVGFVNELANQIVYSITKGKISHVTLKKPLGCSLCMSTWLTLIVLLVMNWKLAPLCLVFGYLTSPILSVMQIIDMLINRLLGAIQELLTK